MDSLMEEDPGEYNMLGAVDANLTYHFSKRGYIYEVAPWLEKSEKEILINLLFISGR